MAIPQLYASFTKNLIVSLCLVLLAVTHVAAQDIDLNQLQGDEPPAGAVWLDSFDVSTMSTGYGTVGLGRSCERREMQVDGAKFKHGVGTHAVSNYTLQLAGLATRFVSAVGLDDEVGSNGSVEFLVCSGKRVLVRSGVLKGDDRYVILSADIKGLKEITLVVTDVDGANSDHADWAGAAVFLTPSGILASSALTGQPGVVLKLLEKEPYLASYLDVLSQTPLNWALAEGVENTVSVLSNAVTRLPSVLRQQKPPANAVWLEALEPNITVPGNYPPQLKVNTNRQSLKLKDIIYPHGIGCHSTSEFLVSLNGKARMLSLLAGIDARAGKEGSTRLSISADGRRIADSEIMRTDEQPKLIVVDVSGIRQLKIRIDDAQDGQSWDMTDLAGCVLTLTPDEALHAAASGGRIEELNTLLTADKSKIDPDDELFKLSPFWTACMAGQVESASLLAKFGCDVNSTGPLGNTVLHFAAIKGQLDAFGPALNAGTDPRIRNDAGQTAHEIALANGDSESVARLSDAELWKSPQESARLAGDFTVNDLKGKAVTLSKLKGKTIALFFMCLMPWNKGFEYTWLDYAQKLNDSPDAKRGDLIVLVATPESAGSAEAFIKENKYTFQVLMDPKDTIRHTLGLYAMPCVLIDSEGRIAWQRRMWQRTRIEDSGLFLAVNQILARKVTYRPNLPAASGGSDSEEILFDFEKGYSGWKTSGDCWDDVPATDALYPGLVKGYVGRSFLGTFNRKGWEATGIACSPTFKITKKYIHFLIGGGDFPDHCAVSLVADGCAVRRTTGINSSELRHVCWDVGDLAGKSVHFEMFDAGKVEPRDFVFLDEIVASESMAKPKCYAKLFDPDDPNCSQEVAASTSEAYKSLQNGQFHIDAIPGRTYRLERSMPVQWSGGSANWLQILYELPPSHLAETVLGASMTIDMGGRTYNAVEINTGRPVMNRALLCQLPVTGTSSMKATAKIKCEMIINQLQLVAGPPPTDPGDLPPNLRAAYTACYHAYPYDKPWLRSFMDEHKLWRQSGETDAAYLLRAYRFFQRSFSYTNVPWGGYPTTQPWMLNSFESQTADCGLAGCMATLLRANDIPTLCGQGCWAGETGDLVGAHVRMLAFIRKVGWLWLDVGPEVRGETGPITIGNRWDDNFFSDGLADIVAESRLPNPPAGKKSVKGWFSGGEWWRSWLVKKPVEVPIVPTADSQPVEWIGTDFQPSPDWAKLDYPAEDWTTNKSGFGTLNIKSRPTGTEWTSQNLWLRKEFTLSAGQVKSPRLKIQHDQDAEVYINGVLAAQLSNSRWDYTLVPLSSEAYRALKLGRNVIAVHCRNQNPPQNARFIDVGLVDIRP